MTGELTIAGTQVTGGSFTADLTTVQSDESRRDRQFQGQLMNTAEFPTATFTLTAPIELGGVPADGTPVAATATGDLTLRGTTRPVTLEVQAQKNGDTIQVVGSTDIVFADYGIPLPDAPGITTQDHGLLEFDLHFTPSLMDGVRVGPTVVIPAGELAWRFSRSSGAGGQHVNTTDSRVELSWDLERSAALTERQRALARHRLGARAGRRGAHGGRVRAAVAAAQPEAAMARLADLVAAAIAAPSAAPTRRGRRGRPGSAGWNASAAGARRSASASARPTDRRARVGPTLTSRRRGRGRRARRPADGQVEATSSGPPCGFGSS